MKTFLIHLLIFFSLISTRVFGQNENQKVMTDFAPKSNAYRIYYPKSFILNEDSMGIVTIADSAFELNISISSYLVDKKINDEKLIEQLNGFVKNYFNKEITRANWNSYKTKFDVLVELKISDEKMNWIWWGVVNKNRLVLISINKKEPITAEDTSLLQFMINNLIINN